MSRGRMRTKVLVFTGLMVLVFAGTALATHKLNEERFNPGGADVTLASAKIIGAGNPDDADPATRGWLLALSETVAYPPGASADLTIKFHGKRPVPLNDLGFDYMTTSHCTGGSPRFNVEIGDDTYAFGCSSGTHTDLGNGWVRVNFDDDDVQLLGADDPWPGFGDEDAQATFLQVVADEGPGISLLDNVNVNGAFIGS